ncbi:MAG TPA: histidine--tRNA ligase [Gemmatimonadaceae bacterium]
MSAGALPGFRDFYPKELAEREYIFRAWHDVARRFGFEQYDGPPLESLDLYTKKSGEEIVGQLYNFTDKGGREVALRPEMTPSFARMVSARANSLRKPVRWYSIPQLFRYERQQKGRLREHFQLNVDIVGETEIGADAELLAVALEVMKRCGLTSDDVVARVSDRRLLSALLSAWGVPDESVSAAYAAIDKIDRDARDKLVERLRDAGVPDDVSTLVLDSVADSDLGSLLATYGHVPAIRVGLEGIEQYQALMAAHGLEDWVRFDLSIVRGLAYYTGIVFELFDRKGEFRAICGGGRYDNLLRDLGDVDLPALGFGMGDVVLGELLKARGLMPSDHRGADFYIAAEDPVTDAEVVRLATSLRHLGASVEYAFRRGALGKQRKAAWSAEAKYIIEVRPMPEGNKVMLRDGAGAGYVSAVSNERTLGDIVGDALLELDHLVQVVRAHPRSVRPDFRSGS